MLRNVSKALRGMLICPCDEFHKTMQVSGMVLLHGIYMYNVHSNTSCQYCKHIHTVHTHCKNGVVMYKCVGLVYFKKIHVEYPDTSKQVHH